MWQPLSHLELVTYFFFYGNLYKVLLEMLHVDPVILTIRAPWAAGRSKPLSMAHCLKTWRISSPGAPGMVCWTPKKNTQQSLLNKTGSHWKVTEKKKVVRDWSYPKTEFRTADNWWILMGCMEDLQHVDGVLYKNSWRFWVSMFPCYHQILGERLCFYRRGDIS